MSEDAGSAIPSRTRLESVEDIRRAFAQERTPTVKENIAAAQGAADARTFRPFRRPPTAIVCILDDNGETGEMVRVRQEKVVVGRAEGGILIPHDDGMSGKHFELYRTLSQGRWRWYVRDLDSTNGTFARVATAELRHRQEVLLGSRRFCLLLGSGVTTSEAPAPDDGKKSTRPWQPATIDEVAQSEVCLAEVSPAGLGRKYTLGPGETWIGADAACAIAITDDPFLSPRHAKLFLGPQRHWCIQNNGSRNGTWLRIDKLAVDAGGLFQAGEQRFLIKTDEA